jgi:predicted GIY-YIG superfamily endonuclease
MKKYYVYKIKEKKTNKVVYIGETKNPTHRWNVHVSNQGKFNKNEHYMDIIDEYVFNNKKDAFNYQCNLQIQYGFQTDYKTLQNNGVIGAAARKIAFDKRGINATTLLCYNYQTKKFIREYKSLREAQRHLNVTNIDKVLNKKYKQVGGYYFKYK